MVGSSVVGDTSLGVQALVVERWRAMSPSDRFRCVAELNESCERLAEVGVRRRYPFADDDEVWLRVVALRLGREAMVTVFGWDPVVEGW